MLADRLASSGIMVAEVRIRNFRSIEALDVKLERLTVLLGENNAGKSAFLQALHVALGVGPPTLAEDDIYVGSTEPRPPKERTILIDILVRPVNDLGESEEHFALNGFWSVGLWKGNIGQDDKDHEFIGIRTRMVWSPIKNEYITDRLFLQAWPAAAAGIEAAPLGALVEPRHIEPIALSYIDTRRDLQAAIRTAGSAWHQMFSNPGLDENALADLEVKLATLSEEIVQRSPVLTHVQDHLNAIYQTVAGEEGKATVAPLARNLRDLHRGIDINLSTKGSQSFPLDQHGMGTRSFGAILAFRAYSTWRQLRVKDELVHPMLALEEPESHLHPQAQRAVFGQIGQIPGQCIVSTHSPYIVSQADIGSLRYFRKTDATSQVTAFDTTSISREELSKIRRKVIATRGEILFARVVVLFEGETEEQALPVFAEEYWGVHPTVLGISLVGVGGAGSYLPFLRLLTSLKIPWYLFSDGELDPLRHVQSALTEIGMGDYPTCGNVVVLPNGEKFESHLIASGYLDTLREFLNTYHEAADYLQSFMDTKQGQRRGQNQTWDFEVPGGDQLALLEILKRGKTQYGEGIAKQITGLADTNRRFPPRVKMLLDKISADFGLTQKEGG